VASANLSKHKTPVKVQVTGIKEIAPGVHILNFERFSDFVAGQMLWLATHKDGPARLYSLASGESESEFEVLFDEKPGGALTPLLSRLIKGDTIYASIPFGGFTGRPGKALWIATGTGIAPFVSMARSGKADENKLIQGGRYLSSFYYAAIFEAISSLEYIRCCSRETAPEIYTGRVSDYIAKAYQPENHQHLICGNAEMVVEVRDLLITRGIAYENINSEIYF
jgi:NAD(P)H-flavin reductase